MIFKLINKVAVGYFLFLGTNIYSQERMIYGETEKVDTFDPYTVHEASGKRLSDLIFDSLVNIKINGEYYPSLAKNWQVVNSGESVVFNLRNDVFWHKTKTNFTAKDVVTTIRLLKHSKSEIPNKSRFNIIKSVEKINDYKIKINLQRVILDPMKLFSFKILPHHVLGSSAFLQRKSKFSKHPIGTGAYYFVKANAQGEVLLERNSNYYKKLPKIKNVIMKTFTDNNIMAQSLMFNSLDLMTYVSPRSLSEIKGDINLGVSPYDALSFSFIALNNKNIVLKNKLVRKAIAFALNKKQMLKAFFQNQGQIISGPFPPTSWAYNIDVKPVKYNKKKAKELLKLAGLRDSNKDGFLESKSGKKISLLFVIPIAGESELVKRIVLSFQSFMREVGLKVELQFMDWTIWKKRVLALKDYDITIGSWSFDDSTNIMSLFHSSSSKPWGNNFVNFNNNKVDSLLSAASSTNDFDKKRAIYHKLHKILADESPYVYLWTLKHHAAYNNKLHGVEVSAYGFFKTINNWYIGSRKL